MIDFLINETAKKEYIIDGSSKPMSLMYYIFSQHIASLCCLVGFDLNSLTCKLIVFGLV